MIDLRDTSLNACISSAPPLTVRVRALLSILLALFIAAMAPSWVGPARGAGEIASTVVEARSAVVIAYLPGSAGQMSGTDANDARATISRALDQARRCIGERDISYHVVVADEIVLRTPVREERFPVAHFAPLPGAILYRPGVNARIVVAGGGPDALVELLPASAADYFGRACQ